MALRCYLEEEIADEFNLIQLVITRQISLAESCKASTIEDKSF